MVWPHLNILGHGKDSSAGDSDLGARRRGRQKKRWEDNIKDWMGMEFGDSLRAAEDTPGKRERYCCNVICGAPTTSKVKGLR